MGSKSRVLAAAAIAVAAARCAMGTGGGVHTGASTNPRNESRFSLDGKQGRLRVSDGGDQGIPVVFVHGLGGDLDAWRDQLAHLRPARRAIAYDQRGHGESEPARDGDYSIDALADDLDAVVSALGAEKFFLVGHSLAGDVIGAYAAKHPDKVAGLLFVDPVGNLNKMPKEQLDKYLAEMTAPSFDQAKLQGFFSQLLGPKARPQTRERVLAAAKRLEPKTFSALWKSMAACQPEANLARYPGPKLTVDTPENDNVASLWRIVEGLPRKTLPGTSHWLMMDDPAAFNSILDAFTGFSPPAPDAGTAAVAPDAGPPAGDAGLPPF